MSALGPDWFSGAFESLSESFVFETRFGRGFRSSAAKKTIHSLNQSSFTENKWPTLLHESLDWNDTFDKVLRVFLSSENMLYRQV